MPEAKMKFEEAIEKLEGIVKKMEEGNLSLEQALKLFEEGTGLSLFCEKSLNEAQGQVEKLMTSMQGERIRVPFDHSEN